jgi:hypothetical protein
VINNSEEAAPCGCYLHHCERQEEDQKYILEKLGEINNTTSLFFGIVPLLKS